MMRDALQNVHLYILGTAHSVQCGVPGADAGRVAAFTTQLRAACREHGIARIAEEMSEAALAHQGVKRTIGAGAAHDLSIVHQMVDLEPAERHALSLDDGPVLALHSVNPFPDGGGSFRNVFSALADGVRERVWIGRIVAGKGWPVLFICGDDHCDAVAALWRTLRLPVTVIARDLDR